jgi:Right handed beta helix region
MKKTFMVLFISSACSEPSSSTNRSEPPGQDLVTTRSALTVSVTAIPNDNLDDRAAFQSAIDTVYAAGGGVVFIPAGVYDLNQNLDSMTVLVKPNVTLRGAGKDLVTIRQMAGASPAARMFTTEKPVGFPVGSPINVAFEEFTMDGQRLLQSVQANAQRHGIFAQHQGISIRNLAAKRHYGDGVYLYNGVSTVTINGLSSSDNGRHGLGAGGQAIAIKVANSSFTNNTLSGIQIEPGGSLGVEDLEIKTSTITGNLGVAVSLAGNPTVVYSKNLRLDGNTTNGSVVLNWVQDVLVQNNTLQAVVPMPASAPGVLTVRKSCLNVLVQNNPQIRLLSGSGVEAAAVAIMGEQPNDRPQNVTVIGNQIVVDGDDRYGINASAAHSVYITSNTIFGPGTATSTNHWGTGVKLRSVALTGASQFLEARVKSNIIRNFNNRGMWVGLTIGSIDVQAIDIA